MVIVLVVTAALAIAGCGALTVLARSYVAKPGPATAVVDPRNGQLIESEVIAHQRPETPVEVPQPTATQPTLPPTTPAW